MPTGLLFPSTKRTKLLISTDDKDVFPMYSTVEVLGVNGYDETGQIELEGNLMLYVAGIHTDDQLPIVIAINGPRVNPPMSYIRSLLPRLS